eukprot:g79735.t1
MEAKTSYQCIPKSSVKDIRVKFQEKYASSLQLTSDEAGLLCRFLRYDTELLDRPEAKKQETLVRAGVIVSSPQKSGSEVPPTKTTAKTAKSVPTEKITKSVPTGKEKGSPSSKGKTKEKRKCPACYESFELEQHLLLQCGHSLCSTCWHGTVSAKLSEGPSGIFSRCPGLDTAGKPCTLVLSEAVMTRFLSETEIKTYRNMLDRHFVEACSQTFYCPGISCDTVFSLSHSAPAEVQCSACGNKSCTACHQQAHAPCPCDLVKVWHKEMEVEDGEAASLALIESLAKPCPRCTSKIMKEPGCNHIRCSVCNFHFCWQCMGEMAAGTWAHPDWDSCRVRSQRGAHGFLSEEESSRIHANQILSNKKYFRQQVREASKDCETTQQIQAKVKALMDELEDTAAVSWLLDVSTTLSDTAQVLKWSFIFSCFLASEEKEAVEGLYNSLQASFSIVLNQVETFRY